MAGAAKGRSTAIADKAAEHWAASEALTGGLLGDRLMDAVAECIARDGFDTVSIEAIATEAGISRTTIYRRFGSRDALFTALFVRRAQPMVDWARSVARGAGTVAERIERIIVRAVLSIQQVQWLNKSLEMGISPSVMRLFKAANRITSRETLQPLLECALGDRAARAGVTVEYLIEWTAEQMLVIAAVGRWTDEEALKRYVRFFMMAVLAPVRDVERQIEARLDAIEHATEDLLSRVAEDNE